MPNKRVLFKVPAQRGQRGHVILNWSGEPIRDLDRVAESYREVARDRVDALRTIRGPLLGGAEFEAYPIVFLYRQAFELTLKATVLAGAVFLRDIGQEPMPLERVMRHDLSPLFEEVSRIFEAMEPGGSPWDFGIDGLRTEADFRRLVSEFDFYDRGSYAFRYTIKKDGTTASLDRHFEFDLFHFAAFMDRVLPALGGAPGWIRDEMQERWEAAYEAQQEAWASGDYDHADFDYEPPDYDPSDIEPPDYESE